MKKSILLAATIVLALSASAQLRPAEMEQAHAEFRRTHQARVPQIKPNAKLAEAPAAHKANTLGSKNGTNEHTASQLPPDRWFPGEWEEVQAIVVTWPYWSVPANWQQLGQQLGYYSCQPQFSGYGDIFRYNNGWQYQGFGPID